MAHLAEVLTYNEGQVFWNPREGPGKRFTGKAAGCRRKDGYVVIPIQGKLQLRHRIVWEMFNGPIPDGLTIDHINGCRGDDRVENLRLATYSENKFNSPSRKNTSGVKNVSFHKATGKWRVRLRAHNRYIHGGLFADIWDAAAAAEELRTKYHSDFNNSEVI